MLEEVSQSTPRFHLPSGSSHLRTVDYPKQPSVTLCSFQAGQGCLSFCLPLLNIWSAGENGSVSELAFKTEGRDVDGGTRCRDISLLLEVTESLISTATEWGLKRPVNTVSSFTSELCTHVYMQPVLSRLKIWK